MFPKRGGKEILSYLRHLVGLKCVCVRGINSQYTRPTSPHCQEWKFLMHVSSRALMGISKQPQKSGSFAGLNFVYSKKGDYTIIIISNIKQILINYHFNLQTQLESFLPTIWLDISHFGTFFAF